MLQKLSLFIFTLLSLPLFAQDILISQGGSVELCAGMFYDSGGPDGDYGPSENMNITLCSEDPDGCIVLDFASIVLENNIETMIIFDGPELFGEQLAFVTGSTNNFTVSSTQSCMTIFFVSDGDDEFSGWEGEISCSACPTCNDGLQNGFEDGVDCGGPDCDPCPCEDVIADSFPFTYEGSTCGWGVNFDAWELCGNFVSGGEDIVITYTPEEDGCFAFSVTDYPFGNSSLIVTDACPTEPFALCLYSLIDFIDPLEGTLFGVAGETYYFTLTSDDVFLPCFDFTFNITDDCPPLSSSDCLGAVPVCEEFYSETDAPLGAGVFLNEIGPASCNFVETNSIWYTFTVQEDGLLSFIIEPNNNNDDYDWALFDITEFSCEDITTNADMEVSCNSWGTIGVNGPTGISTAEGGDGNFNGPGNLNGPPFNADLPVLEGETYALVVMNWSNSIEGYALDFGGSTASIFDDVAPELTEIEIGCAGTEILVTFSEPILCESLQPEDFIFTGPGGDTSPIGVENDLCTLGASATSVVTLILSEPLEPGNYTLSISDLAEDVVDQCDNAAIGSLDFIASDVFTVDVQTQPACNPGTGEIDASDVSGGLAPFVFSLDGDEDGNGDGVFEGLDVGSYTLTVMDEGGCEIEMEIEVDGGALFIDAGEDQTPCDLSTGLLGDAVDGEFMWSADPAVNFSDPSNPLSSASVSLADQGAYILTATITSGVCEASDEVVINFSPPIQYNTEILNVSCYDFCDGELNFASSLDNLNYSTDGGLTFGPEQNPMLCAGNYDILVADVFGCIVEDEVTVSQPPPIIAGYNASPQPTAIPFTEVSFDNVSDNALEFLWYFGELDSSTEENPTYTFPIEQGGIYPVSLVVTDLFGCQDSLVRFIIIEEDFQVFIPNAFSPNGDGLNDVWIPQFSSTPEVYEIIVFNRWGEIVFSSEDRFEPWLGNHKDGQYFVEAGVYTWILKAGRKSLDAEEWQGHVVVVR